MSRDDNSGYWLAAILTTAAVFGIGIWASAANTNNLDNTSGSTQLAFMEYYPYSDAADFQAAVIAMAQALGVDPNWLMYIMYNESAGSFNPAITNGLGYTGLIQFSADGAKTVGTTQAALKQMTAVQQLQYVQAYLQYWINIVGTPKNLYDTYLLVFYPDAVNKPDTYTFPDNVVADNPEFFKNIGNTKAAFVQGVNNHIPDADKARLNLA